MIFFFLDNNIYFIQMKKLNKKLILFSIILFFLMAFVSCATTTKSIKTITGNYKSKKNSSISISKLDGERFKVILSVKYGTILYKGILQNDILNCKSNQAKPIILKFSENLDTLILDYKEEKFSRVD